MGWSIGFDSKWNRDIGYGVPATCDYPGCGEAIDRGLSFVCGGEPYGGEKGCGLYFCGSHLTCSRKLGGPPTCRCAVAATRAGRRTRPTPDARRVGFAWKLTDESWARWRDENPEKVGVMKAAVSA